MDTNSDPVGTDDIEAADDYTLSSLDGIDDESELESSASRKFSITSYGADYTVDSLVKRMKSGAFRIPTFQRRYVWSQRQASKFIESLLMGLPVPGVFLYKEQETNKHLVIDGQQRLRTLQQFFEGNFGEKKFRLLNVSEPWLNKTYGELDVSDQLKLEDSIVHATIFQQDEPQDALDSVYFVFERINTGGVHLSSQEIRNCIAAGPFVERIKTLNEGADWRSVFGAPVNRRAKDEEMIVRFMALYDRGAAYRAPLSGFLNRFSVDMNRADRTKLDALEVVFRRTIAFVNTCLGASAFRPTRSFNAAVFDAVMVGLARRLDDRAAPECEPFQRAYEVLLNNEEFKRYWERSTADEMSVRRRIEIASSAFKDV